MYFFLFSIFINKLPILLSFDSRLDITIVLSLLEVTYTIVKNFKRPLSVN